jgi:hypothetical protein
MLTSLPRNVYLHMHKRKCRRNVQASAEHYMTRKCCEKETTMASMSHLLTQGLTTRRDSLSERAFNALNISTVTKMDKDLIRE